VAKFEVCAHRWVWVTESGLGVGLANDSTYGHDVGRQVAADGAVGTTVRLSLLRAPQFPDPQADQGRHHLACSLVVTDQLLDVIAEGYRLNLPPRTISGGQPTAPLVQLDDRGVIVEAIKLAEDQSGDVIVRLYEATGRRRRARLTTTFDWHSAAPTDLLERPTAAFSLDRPAANQVEIDLPAFAIRTVRFSGARRPAAQAAP
jgi:alpha-mannosidase